jgi:3-oxoacyl-[acyl-carrier protein] reductase
MDLGLHGKIALVTAASHGLGMATARALAREGARLAISARDLGTLERTAAEIREQTGAEVNPFVCDLTQPAQIVSMVEGVIARYGTVHILVNNAGGPPPGGGDNLTDVDWQRAFELTLMSAVRTTRAVLPYMRAQRWGRVVNVSSFSVKQPIPDIMLSNSLRLGVSGWAKTLANQVAADNVLINTVGPGWTRTDRVTQMLASRAASSSQTAAEVEAQITRGVPIGRLAEPEEIADVIVFLASQRASYITGTLLPVDGGVVQSPT